MAIQVPKRRNVRSLYRTLLDDALEERFGRPRVLLAEDDGEMRDVVARALEVRGYEVIECFDGAEMLAYIDALYRTPNNVRPVDIIVTDVRMAGASGIEVLERVRLHDTRVPVFLMTGFPDDAVADAAAEFDVAGILAKPFPTRLLVDACENIAPTR